MAPMLDLADEDDKVALMVLNSISSSWLHVGPSYPLVWFSPHFQKQLCCARSEIQGPAGQHTLPGGLSPSSMDLLSYSLR